MKQAGDVLGCEACDYLAACDLPPCSKHGGPICTCEHAKGCDPGCQACGNPGGTGNCPDCEPGLVHCPRHDGTSRKTKEKSDWQTAMDVADAATTKADARRKALREREAANDNLGEPQ